MCGSDALFVANNGHKASENCYGITLKDIDWRDRRTVMYANSLNFIMAVLKGAKCLCAFPEKGGQKVFVFMLDYF